MLPRHREELVDQLLRLAEPFGDQVGGRNGKERRLGLGRDRFREVTLARPRRPVEQDARPRLALAREELRELDGQDDGLFQGVFRRVEARDVGPLDVRPLCQNRRTELPLQLRIVLVRFRLAALGLLGAGRGRGGGFGRALFEHRLEMLRPLQVLLKLGLNRLLGLGILLVLEVGA